MSYHVDFLLSALSHAPMTFTNQQNDGLGIHMSKIHDSRDQKCPRLSPHYVFATLDPSIVRSLSSRYLQRCPSILCFVTIASLCESAQFLPRHISLAFTANRPRLTWLGDNTPTSASSLARHHSSWRDTVNSATKVRLSNPSAIAPECHRFSNPITTRRRFPPATCTHYLSFATQKQVHS